MCKGWVDLFVNTDTTNPHLCENTNSFMARRCMKELSIGCRNIERKNKIRWWLEILINHVVKQADYYQAFHNKDTQTLMILVSISHR